MIRRRLTLTGIMLAALVLTAGCAKGDSPSWGFPTNEVNSEEKLATSKKTLDVLEGIAEDVGKIADAVTATSDEVVSPAVSQQDVVTPPVPQPPTSELTKPTGSNPDTDATTAEDLFPLVPRPDEGWWPWYTTKANMGLPEFVAALSGDHGKFRVHWQGYSEDLSRMGFPVGDSLESLQGFLISGDISIVDCTPEILSRYYLSRTNKDGSIRDLNFTRDYCYGGELLLFHVPSGRFVLSLGCGNVMRLREIQPSTLKQSQVSCKFTEQEGCFEIDIIAVHNSSTNPELQELLSSAPAGSRKVSEVLGGDIAVRIFEAAEERRIQYYAGCFIVSIRFWGVPSPEIERMSEYRMPTGRSSVGINPLPSPAGDFSQTTIKLSEITTGGSYKPPIEYLLEVCQGKGALQVPWGFLPEGTVIQIEATEVATVFPFSTRQASTKKVGLWLTALQLNNWRANGTQKRLEYVVVPIVFPERRD